MLSLVGVVGVETTVFITTSAPGNCLLAESDAVFHLADIFSECFVAEVSWCFCVVTDSESGCLYVIVFSS